MFFLSWSCIPFVYFLLFVFVSLLTGCVRNIAVSFFAFPSSASSFCGCHIRICLACWYCFVYFALSSLGDFLFVVASLLHRCVGSISRDSLFHVPLFCSPFALIDQRRQNIPSPSPPSSGFAARGGFLHRAGSFRSLSRVLSNATFFFP